MRVTTSGRRWVDKAHRDHAKRQDDDRGRAAPPYAHVDASHQHAYLSPDEASMMRSNAASAHARLFTPELSVKMAQIIERAISMESGGTFVESAGGAHVKSFDSTTINGDTAIVKATVTQWDTVGQIQVTAATQRHIVETF
ncbi:MAG TPA: hypothetical protein VFA94_15495 [Acidimicrobiales bacterium]|nr:hypothetical protein [Acidimicrobiales bacterium]